jgi:hypothetical protein
MAEKYPSDKPKGSEKRDENKIQDYGKGNRREYQKTTQQENGLLLEVFSRKGS